MEKTTKAKTISRFKLSGLYAITPCSSIQSLTTPQLLTKTRQALEGGVRILQYREKLHPAALKQEQALALKTLCRQFDACFLVNDDVALAEAVAADGVHLGREDETLFEARARLGAAAVIGVSCYNQLPLAHLAQKQGASYVAFGRFFPSNTKPNAVQADISLLTKAKEELTLPVACIGGITLDNAKLLVSAGADMLVVLEGLFGAESIIDTARQFTRLMLPD